MSTARVDGRLSAREGAPSALACCFEAPGVGFLTRIALAAGIPDIWLEDCLQEMRISLLVNPTRSLRFVAIDFIRKVNHWQPRQKQGRLHFTSIDGLDFASRDSWTTTDAVIDLKSTWPCLKAREREAILASAGLGKSVSQLAEEQAVSQDRIWQRMKSGRDKLKEANKCVVY